MPKRGSSIRAHVQRNIPGAFSPYPKDAWRNYLLACTNAGAGKSINELEISWLKKNGGSGSRLSELWNTYLNSKAVPAGTLKYRIDYYLNHSSQT